MRGLAALVAAALLASGCTAMSSSSSSGSAASSTGTHFDILIWPKGKPGRATRYTLWCRGPGGERGGAFRPIPNPQRSCARLARLGAKGFAPVPKNVACTAVYGGPQIADVRGVLNGRRVHAVFKRTDGCEIDRWDRVRFLLPAKT